MSLLRDSPDDLFALCGTTADSMGTDPAFVEKDFWVVELLRSVVKPLELEPVNNIPCSATIIFKGGTSLSKAYDLIKRFSEDVDILVKIKGYGANAREKRVLRPICDRARDDLGLTSDQVTMLLYSTGVNRIADYAYPSRIGSAAIRAAVRLEMGIRGGTMPGTQRRKVRSHIAQYIATEGIDADYDELAPVEVNAIAPVRTLAEKLALLHDAGRRATEGKTEPLQKAGRHLYDVHQLLHSEDLVAALSAPGQTMTELATDVDAHSEEYHWPYTPRPDSGYASSLVFDPSGPVRAIIEDSYQLAMDLVWDDKPTFDDCLATVADARQLL